MASRTDSPGGIPGDIPGVFTDVDGIVLHAVVQGSGPSVICTTGLAGAWFDFEPLVPLLTGPDHCTLVRFDRPGLGFSAPDPRPPTLRREADRIATLAARLGIPPPYTLVAHSLAGFHAEAFARLHPELTAGLVLVDPSNEPAPHPFPAPALRLAANRAVGEAVRVTGLARPVGPLMRRAVVRGFSRSRREPGDPALVRRAYGSGRFLTAALSENSTYRDVAAELIALRAALPMPDVPLRVLAAAAGYPRPARERWIARQEALAALAPRGACEVLDDAEHYVMFDRPDAVADAVLAVLREV